jgi:sugar phosphate isomerase/epimerase
MPVRSVLYRPENGRALALALGGVNVKISFMTWACPDWTLDQVLSAAVRYGYDGVEPRVEANQRHGIELETTGAERRGIRSKFADAGIEMSCLATSRVYALGDAAEREASVTRTRQYLELAADLGCPNIRVFGGPTPESMSNDEAQSLVAESLAAAAPVAEALGVSLCLETHDGYCNAHWCAATAKLAGAPGVGIVWDIMHPFRTGQSIEEAFEAVRDLVRHCHAHDALVGPSGEFEMKLMGEGVIPHAEAVARLVRASFPGHISGEYIDFLPPDELLPHEADRLRAYVDAAADET